MCQRSDFIWSDPILQHVQAPGCPGENLGIVQRKLEGRQCNGQPQQSRDTVAIAIPEMTAERYTCAGTVFQRGAISSTVIWATPQG